MAMRLCGSVAKWLSGYVAKFQNCNISEVPLMSLRNIWSILPNFHFMFLIDIDLISKIPKIC